MVIDDHVDELRQECADWKNGWGKVTSVLDLPWDCSAMKVVEEVRKLQSALNTCQRLASEAPQGDCGVDGL